MKFAVETVTKNSGRIGCLTIKADHEFKTPFVLHYTKVTIKFLIKMNFSIEFTSKYETYLVNCRLLVYRTLVEKCSICF